MPDTHDLLLFAAASIAFLLTPGPAVFYIVGNSVRDGRVAGLVSMLGITTGGLVHVAAAVLGLSALLASSASAFNVIKLLGAAYLIYLGIRALATSGSGAALQAMPETSLKRAYLDGFIVNALNPKPALFFMAFLPQFVNPDNGNSMIQFLVLGLLFEVLGLMTDSLWALTAGTLRNWLRRHVRLSSIPRRLSGAIFIGLGLWTALAGHRPGSN